MEKEPSQDSHKEINEEDFKIEKEEAGKNSFPPTPFLFARLLEEYLKNTRSD